MEFLRKHYEKVILSAVLVGLAIAAAWLPMKVQAVRADIEQAGQQFFSPKVAPLEPLDLSTNEAALARVENPAPAVFAQPGHYLFNPIEWEKRPDGTLIPKEDTGLKSLVITEIKPLYLNIKFLDSRKSRDIVFYRFLVEQQAATNRSEARPATRSITSDGKINLFAIKSIKGPEEDPEEIALELTEENREIRVGKDTPFQEIAGYTASLRHRVENRSFSNQRVGDKLRFGGATYNIIAIGKDSVTLEDEKTKKRTTIRQQAPA